MRGKEVVDAQEHAAKIRAAVSARGKADFLITARTDALEELGVEEAIARGHLYREAGADILFVEGPRTREELEQIGRALPPPLAVNLIEGGRTPIASLEELSAMGFISVGFVLSGLYAAAASLERTYSTILAQGSTASLSAQMMDFDRFAEAIGVEEHLSLADGPDR